MYQGLQLENNCYFSTTQFVGPTTIFSFMNSSIIHICLAQWHLSAHIKLIFSYYMHGLISPIQLCKSKNTEPALTVWLTVCQSVWLNDWLAGWLSVCLGSGWVVISG